MSTLRVGSLLLLALAACAASRPRLGDVTLRPYVPPGAAASTFGVQEGRLLGPDLDVALQADGCLRGSLDRAALQLCKQPMPGPTDRPGNERVERWSGTGGDFTVQILQAGRVLRADGYLRSDGTTLPLATTLPLGSGPQWDELRRHPALLAIAAAAVGILGEPAP